ncbi:MAG TPA: DHH family phosphoesterase [Longimicrobiales bacterium]|nr:DHH family phosphoesterase [Longimicrobiales bacterium]
MTVTAPPIARAAALQGVLDRLRRARRVVLTTHVNADGDGTGSEVAVACWLSAIGVDAAIVNPTPYPASFRFLLEAKGAQEVRLADLGTPEAEAALAAAEVILVLDTGEPVRIGKLARALSGRDVIVVDHHPPGPDPLRTAAEIRDPVACATGELVYDLLTLDASYRSWPPAVSQALYTAIATDTGSFRFSNTTPRTHEIVGDLIRRGVDPEAMYGRLYAVPLRRTLLLRESLATLELDAEHGVAWITIPDDAMERLGVMPEDLDGIIEHARTLEGTEVALLFRQTGGSTKVSFRSNGSTDVNAIARAFGGGGHVKAAGALIGGPLEKNRSRVLEAVRSAVRRS